MDNSYDIDCSEERFSGVIMQRQGKLGHQN